jgi:glycosyltransferase involved in cell wall biosynthesis
MRILIVGANYAPETTSVAPFTTGLAEHFAQAGHDVIVATTFPFYPLWHWYEPPPGWRTRELLNGVDVWRTKIVLPPRRTAVWRVAFDFSIALTSALTMMSISRVDVTICLSPPVQTTILGAAIRRRLGKLVMLIKDLPTEAARSVGMLKGGPLLRLGTAFEQFAYRRADHIVVISSAFADYIRRLGVASERISQIPDWADLEAIRPNSPDQAIRSRLGAGPADFLVVHSGNMGAKQDLINVVAAAEMLQSETRIKIALVGDGTERAKIEQAVSVKKLGNLRLLPLQSTADFPKVLSAADGLLVNQAPLVMDSVLPSKLLTYMAAERPVLAAVHPDSTTADLVRRASCGVVAPAGQPAALAAAIRSMADMSKDGLARNEMGVRGRRYVTEHFERKAVLRQWDDLIAGLAFGGYPQVKSQRREPWDNRK